MAAEPGTFERIALLLGDALSPLAERLQPDSAVGHASRARPHLPDRADDAGAPLGSGLGGERRRGTASAHHDA